MLFMQYKLFRPYGEKVIIALVRISTRYATPVGMQDLFLVSCSQECSLL